MASPGAEKLGRLLMERVRDPSINFFYDLRDGDYGSEHWRGLAAALAAMDPEQRAVVRRCVSACVDVGIYSLLEALGGSVKALVDGQEVPDHGDEMHHELNGDDNWIRRFSSFPESA